MDAKRMRISTRTDWIKDVFMKDWWRESSRFIDDHSFNLFNRSSPIFEHYARAQLDLKDLEFVGDASEEALLSLLQGQVRMDSLKAPFNTLQLISSNTSMVQAVSPLQELEIKMGEWPECDHSIQRVMNMFPNLTTVTATIPDPSTSFFQALPSSLQSLTIIGDWSALPDHINTGYLRNLRHLAVYPSEPDFWSNGHRLIRALEQCPNLEILDIPSAELPPNYVPHFPSLQELHAYTGSAFLVSMLKASPKLRRLIITTRTGCSFQAFSKLSSTVTFPNLEKIIVTCTSGLVIYLDHLFSHSPALEDITIDCDEIYNNEPCDALVNRPRLKMLRVTTGNTPSSWKFLSRLGQELDAATNLECLTINSASARRQHIDSILYSLINGACPSMYHLSISCGDDLQDQITSIILSRPLLCAIGTRARVVSKVFETSFVF